MAAAEGINRADKATVARITTQLGKFGRPMVDNNCCSSKSVKLMKVVVLKAIMAYLVQRIWRCVSALRDFSKATED